VTADGRFTAALRALTAALDELGAPSMIIGGIAVIAAGVPRETIDIDATILGRAAALNDTVASLARQGITPRVEGALEFARERQVLLLQHGASGVTIELSFAWLPFEEEALSRALDATVEHVAVRIARPEDLIVYKAAAWRDRDRSDIERLLVLHLDHIDLDRVRGLVRDIGDALDDPDRLGRFDSMVEQTRRLRKS
jgi:predicted nucleotidyltransferase